jgi:hypothetical protein
MYNKLQDDLKTCMKNKDNEKLSVIRLLYSQIKNEAINLRVTDISDDIFFSVLKKSIKEITENIDNYSKLGREDLSKKEKYELSILNDYLPKQLSDEDLFNIVKEEVNKIEGFSQKDIGIIIRKITEEYKNQVDGKRVSDIISKSFL